MSVHIPSTLKVTELNVANTAEMQNLRFREGGGSWLLYADAGSTKLLYGSAVAASFELSEGSSEQFNLRVSGLVYGTGVHASFVKAERATIVGTLEADTLKANTLDVSNLDFSDTTLDVSSITVTGTAEINTLSAIQVLAEQGDIQQLTVDDTLTANNAAMSELTVLQTLHAGTIKARKLAVDGELSANTITASFLDVDGWIDAKSLTVNGVPIMGGGSSGGEGGSSGSMNLTINSLSATQYIEVAGSSADNNIRLSASSGLQLNTGASLTIRNLYDANVDPYVTIDTTGIKAPTIHGQTVKGGTISGGTVRGATLHGASVQAVTAELESLTADVVQAISVRTDNWSLEGNQYTCSLTYSGGQTIPFVSCDITYPAQPVMYLPAQVSATEVSAETFDATDMTLQHSLSIFGASGASIFKLEKSAEEQASLFLTGNATIDGALSVESLTVNGVDITNNGSGSAEIPATIQVSVVEALNSNEAVTIPKLDSDSVTIDGTVDISATGRVNLNNAKFMADATGVSMLDATVTKLTVASSVDDDTSGLWLGGRRLTGFEGELQLDNLSVITLLHANSASITTANVGTLTVENLESSSSSGNIKIGALTVTSSGATIAGAFTANSINVPTGVLTARSVQLSGSLNASSVSITNDLTIGRTLRVGTAGLIISNDSISTPNLYANYIYATSIRDLDSLYTKDLYVNGVQITGNGDGTASGSGFSGQYTGGNVVLGSISNSNFYGFAQKDIITALGYNVYNPSSAEIPPFYDNTAAPAGIRIAPSEVVVGAQGGRLTLDAPSLQVYGGYGGSDIRVDTKDLKVADNESGSFMIRLHASSSYGPKLFIGEPDRVDGFRLSSLDIAAANMTLLGYQNSQMFALYSTSSASSLTLKTASNNAALTLHSDIGLKAKINGTDLIYTDENGTGGWQFGNVSTGTNFYTNYKSLIRGLTYSGAGPQEVLDAFAATGRIHACLPLSLMLALFQLNPNVTLPQQS